MIFPKLFRLSSSWAVFLAVVGAVLMIYRVRPFPNVLPNSWAGIMFGVVLIFWSAHFFLRRKPIVFLGSSLGWILIAFWVLIQTRFVEMRYVDALIFPVSSLILAFGLHVVCLNSDESHRVYVAKVLAAAFLMSSLGTSLVQTIQLMGWKILVGYVIPLPLDMQPYGNLAQRNQAAFVHVLGMLAWAHLWTPHGSSRTCMKWVGMLLCLPMVWGLAMTSSRLFLFMGGLAWVASAWQLGLLGRNLSGKGAWVQAVLMGFLLALAYAVCYAGFTAATPWLAPEVVFDNVVERLGNVSNQTRVVLQQQAWVMFTQSPLVGMGWGSFSAFALQWSDRSALPMFADHSHFLPSHWLAELGLVGVVMALPLIVLMIRLLTNVELWRRHFFLQSFGIATLLYSCSEYPLWEGYFLFPFVLILGLLEAELGGVNYGFLAKIKSKKFSFLWIMILGVMMVIGGVWTAKSYVKMHVLGQQVFTGKKDDAKVYEEIASVSWAFGFSAIRDVYLFVILPIDADNLDAKIELGERVSGRFVDANVLQRLAFMYAVKGDYERSMRLMKDACRFYPERCEKILEDLFKVPEDYRMDFEVMHAELTQWWSNHPRNPARPPG